MNTRQVIFHRFAMWVAMGQGALFLVPGQIWKGMHGQNRKCVCITEKVTDRQS
jgi:hypothetical protein